MNVTGAQPQAREEPSGSPPLPGPFGYSFGANQDTPYDPGPAPPPGPSLLDVSESNMLDNFFTTLNTGQLDMGDTWFNALSQEKGTNPFGLDWADELPPTFEGSATSLSQAPALPYNSNNGPKRTNSLMGGMGPDSDILAAASMLYGNGIHTASNFGTHNFFPDSAMHGIPPTSQHQHQHALKQEEEDRPHQRLLRPQHTTSFNLEQPTPADPRTTTNVRTLRWGSDAGFVDQGYLRPPEMPNVEEQTNSLLDHVTVLLPDDSTSATNTRATSPARNPPENANDSGWGVTDDKNASHLRQGSRDKTESNLPPRKRLKAKSRPDENSDDTGTPPRMKRPKSSSGGKQRRGSNDLLSRKLSSKAARENLTEEQKRTNHILSEQKRRNLIKTGFEDLCSLVPELRGGGFSKSAMLLQAADYLDEVLQGNDVLRQQLNQLKAMNGFLIPR
ncbi:uncharacterized protein TRUGW13939_07042 [Talaromyces rugulosus]|uniref:BHLH domain-containing protein n=1 Tax=Talaromyces rugulosus TaxID=121627 RepID=A0A7H8R0K6_TALRU|nr:uncharacterized protein TRUGW13939_07042 [Talaromyces rugulosus]QKX59900.1 hypothetical protein TRUGW13939_07042 [Talaromyces rugulosus]